MVQFNVRGRKKFLEFVSKPDNVKRILIIRNGLLGDVTALTGTINRLVSTFPNVEIDLLVGPRCKNLLNNIPNIRKVFFFNYTTSFLSVLKQIGFFMGLGKNKYDIIEIHEVSSHFTLMSLLTKTKYRVGFTNKKSGWYDYHIERPKVKMALAETRLVEEWTNPPIAKTGLVATNEEREAITNKLVEAGLTKGNSFAIIHIGSSHHNSDRQWQLSKVPLLAEKLKREYGFDIVFTGVKEDIPSINIIMEKCSFKTFSLADKTTLRELIALVDVSNIVIGPDTGIIHIAASLNTPSVMMMGLSDPEDTGSYNEWGNAEIVTAGLKCQPCVHSNPKPEQWNECKDMRPVKCMEAITVEMVLEKVSGLIGN